MLLGDKQGVEVPEAGLDISGEALAELIPDIVIALPVGWHFLEAHLKENLSELMPYFIQGV